MYYEKIFKELQKAKVKYLIAGGMAVNLYGVPRFTKDLDLLVDISPLNLSRLKRVLEKLKFRPKVPMPLSEFLNPKNWKKWHREKGMKALNLYNPARPYEEIDILVFVSLSFDKARKNRVVVHDGALRLSLVSLDDLIRMKKSAHRAQDKADIRALKQIRKSGSQ